LEFWVEGKRIIKCSLSCSEGDKEIRPRKKPRKNQVRNNNIICTNNKVRKEAGLGL
jgi:hypothetical protein